MAAIIAEYFRLSAFADGLSQKLLHKWNIVRL
jgi:hypothetical protein